MVYRNKLTGREVVTECIICAPQFELIETPTKETPPAETSGESLTVERPKKRTPKRAKK